jgi:hypothetical protein
MQFDDADELDGLRDVDSAVSRKSPYYLGRDIDTWNRVRPRRLR